MPVNQVLGSGIKNIMKKLPPNLPNSQFWLFFVIKKHTKTIESKKSKFWFHNFVRKTSNIHILL